MPKRSLRLALAVSGLGRGGAERQLVQLAKELHKRGHHVEVWCYGADSVIDNELRQVGISVRNGTGTRRSKVSHFRRWLVEFQPDVVHGFMKRASSLSVIARGTNSRPVVVASDMSTATYGKKDLTL